MKSLWIIFFVISAGFNSALTPPTNIEEEPAAVETVVNSRYVELEEETIIDADAENLAVCLQESGTTMYGAYWCSHCQEQKKIFGDAATDLPYIECDAGGENADPEACIEAGIKSYPTWKMSGGEDLVGTQSFDELKSWSGC